MNKLSDNVIELNDEYNDVQNALFGIKVAMNLDKMGKIPNQNLNECYKDLQNYLESIIHKRTELIIKCRHNWYVIRREDGEAHVKCYKCGHQDFISSKYV